MPEDKKSVVSKIKEYDIKFIKLQFIDLFGELKNISITSSQIEKALSGKCMIDSFHISGMSDLGYDRIFLKPDCSSFTVLPWRPQQGKVARLLCDITDVNGVEIIESPRHILKEVLSAAEHKGYSFDIKPKCEFFLFNKDERGQVVTQSEESAGYLDVAPLDKGENARRELILSLEEMGFEIESSRHELAPNQHSVEFKQLNGIRLADQIITFRTTIRTVAERYGLHATFMPKPRTDLPGSTMKFTFSVSKDGQNILADENTAKHFIAGLLEHQIATTAFSNPLINSYKRLKATYYAPSELYWSRHDHYAPLRLLEDESGAPCVEWTLPDGAANPYLVIVALISAGLKGVETKAKIVNEDVKLKPLPATLHEAILALKKDELLRSVCSDSFIKIYVNKKNDEWDRYSREVTDWELKEYLKRI